MIIHYDLFSGIGGFAYAIDQVYGKEKTKHIFVEIDPFCWAVLRKHWPNSEIHGDIRQFITDTRYKRQEVAKQQTMGDKKLYQRPFILTGGFPCQPFSQSGVRKGTSDERYLWTEMFKVISEVKPNWVIAENVRGLLTIQGGMVFEQVCADLESQDYEVQAFIIPAYAVGAPHRRDRVWIVAHSTSEGLERGRKTAGCSETDINAQHPIGKRSGRRRENGRQILERPNSERWERSWQEVAFERCIRELDDGLSGGMVRLPDGTKISYARWRKEGLKAFGNSIVPAVAIQILKGIRFTEVKHPIAEARGIRNRGFLMNSPYMLRKESESQIQKALVAWFRMQYPHSYIIAIGNGAWFQGDNRFRLVNHYKKMGMTPGVSDLFIPEPHGSFHGMWLELKSKGIKPGREQTLFLKEMSEKNYHAAWADSFEDAKITIKNYLGDQGREGIAYI